MLRFVPIEGDRSSILGCHVSKIAKNGEQDYSPFGQSVVEIKSLSIQSPLPQLPNWCCDSVFSLILYHHHYGNRKKDSKQQWNMQLCICHHYLLLASAVITELGSVFDLLKKSRRKSILDQCLVWHVFDTHHSICPKFCQHLCMTFQSFQKLVGLLTMATGKPGDGITMWWCHHTRTVCIHHTSVPGRWIIHRYILPRWYFTIFFFVYYGRQLRQLTIVQSYRLLAQYQEMANQMCLWIYIH